MELTIVKTPTLITPNMKKLCLKLSCIEPVFVNVLPPSWALQNKCALNAKRYAEENDGKVIFGWSVSIWDKVLLDCIGHAVVKINDELIDVTPNKYMDKKVLFVQDNEIDFDYSNKNSRMPSRNIAISSSVEVKRIVSIENEIYNIKIKYPVNSGLFSPSLEDGRKISELEEEKNRITGKVIMTHTHHNAPCICGSGRKFRKCCQGKLR